VERGGGGSEKCKGDGSERGTTKREKEEERGMGRSENWGESERRRKERGGCEKGYSRWTKGGGRQGKKGKECGMVRRVYIMGRYTLHKKI